MSLIIVIIVVFVVGEVVLSIIMGAKASETINRELEWIEYIRFMLRSKDEAIFDSIPKEKRKHKVIDYLATCAETEQQVNVTDFFKLLSTKTEQAFEKIYSVMNVLPIIGLMGTFLGIVIGISRIKLDSSLGIGDIIQPLINAAGLAFVSSLTALICATVLKAIFGVKRNAINQVINDTENTLLIDYIPHIAPKNTEDRFAKTVKKFDMSISKFVKNFQQSYSEFIAEFKPLVEDQKNTNVETIKAIEIVSVKLAENTESLKQISTQQSNQIESLNTVITNIATAGSSLEGSMEMASKTLVTNITATGSSLEGIMETASKTLISNITTAGSSLEGSIEVASKTLREFERLGVEMKNSISEMHTPLKEIIEKQIVIIQGNNANNETINKLFRELPDYNQNVMQYLNALNDKLDTFREVGEKVHDVKAEFGFFSTHMGEMLKQFTIDSEKFRLLMETNFGEYDTALRKMFQGISEKSDIDMFYYDPEAIKLLQKLATENGLQLSQMEKATNSFDKSTESLLKAMNDLGFWGFFRRNKKEIKGGGK